MGRLNTAFLKTIAEAYLERPVFVGHLPRDTSDPPMVGRADYEGCYQILLDVTMRKERLPHTFFHEVGHLVLGHVPDHVIEGRRHTAEDIAREIASGPEPEAWRRVQVMIADMEKEANEWADTELPIWEAQCQAKGMTFEQLAIIQGDDND